MALSKELLQCLNCDEEPIAKRLKFAHNVLHDTNLPFIHKNDVILQWLCMTSQKDSRVWQTLNLCLCSDNVDGGITLRPEIKEKLIDSLIDSFNIGVKTGYYDILICCCWIFSNVGMQQYFRTKLSKFGQFSECLLRYMYKFLKSNDKESKYDYVNDVALKTDPLTELSLKAAVNCIECNVQIYKQSANKDEFTEMFLNNILYALCAQINTNDTNRLGAETHKCLQHIVFGKFRYTRYKEYVLTDVESIPAKLFSTLKSNILTTNIETNSVVFLYIYRAAISSYKYDPVTLDKIFRYMINSAGAHKIKILSSVLGCLNDIAFDFNNKVEGTTLTSYIEDIIEELLSKETLNTIDHTVISRVCSLNPLIIENKLPAILKKILPMEGNSETEENSLESLTIDIVEASIRLRREQKLVSWFLMALKQSLMENKMFSGKKHVIFPLKFKLRFTRCVEGLTSSQVIDVLKSIMFHLNIDCTEAIKLMPSSSSSVMIRGTIELLVAFFNGVRIAEHTVPHTLQAKFFTVLTELGNTLSLLTEKMLSLKHNNKISVALLCAILSWKEMFNLTKHYASKITLNKTNSLPSSDLWQKLVQRVIEHGNENCKMAVNKIVLHDLKTCEEGENEPLEILNDLVGNPTCSWYLILKHYPEILLYLNNVQQSEIALQLFANETLQGNNGEEWFMILSKESLLENKSFIVVLLCQVLVHLGREIAPSFTSSLTECIDTVKVAESEEADDSEILHLLKSIKAKMEEPKWTCVELESSCNIRRYIDILRHLPLLHLSTNLKTLVFIIIYSVSRECCQSENVTTACNKILLDALEKRGLDIFQYINPRPPMSELASNKVYSKAFKYFLSNVTSYATLKPLITSEECDATSACALLECIENIKSKLTSEQKIIFKKVERKLCRKIVNAFPSQIDGVADIRNITAVLKAAAVYNEIRDDLDEKIKAALNYIFLNETVNVTCQEKDLVQEGLVLTEVLLKHYKTLKIETEVADRIWVATLANPYKNVLVPLLMATPSSLNKLLHLLHEQVAVGLQETNLTLVDNAFFIWDCILNVDMSVARKKLRSTAVHNLFYVIGTTPISKECWLKVLTFFRGILVSKHMFVTPPTIDLIMQNAMKSLREIGILACTNVMSLCLSILRIYTNSIMDRLPMLLLVYRKVVKITIIESRKDQKCFDNKHLKSIALDIERMAISLVKLKRDMTRISPYVIADFVEFFSEGVVPTDIKNPLENAVSHLFSTCDPHAISCLSRALPPAKQEIFKTLYNTYAKFYKFTGKI
ncbi:uncharacterized protein LOC105699860 [Orussus abietinus]|uniref:uncharacterized protein LOC105699860 n=1 Tax=Orussus abietinus TaxID=222816 RepID=UPI0006264DB5|nr:uncharacterized protein LOC105699860 [Orussus abietinus]